MKTCKLCGEDDQSKFYPSQRAHYCKRCWDTRTADKRRGAKLRIIEHLGGRCVSCGYDTYPSALQIHHTDPTKKDPDASRITLWGWARAEKELESCILLCANCHSAYHAGEMPL